MARSFLFVTTCCLFAATSSFFATSCLDPTTVYLRPATGNSSFATAILGTLQLAPACLENFQRKLCPLAHNRLFAVGGYQHCPSNLFRKNRPLGGGGDAGSTLIAFVVVFKNTTMYADSLVTSLDVNEGGGACETWLHMSHFTKYLLDALFPSLHVQRTLYCIFNPDIGSRCEH